MDNTPKKCRTLRTRHNALLRDRVRMEAYGRAIRAVVRPGDLVADLGTGTGALAFLALAAGARHVHAVEVDAATLALAQQEAQHRGLTDRISFDRGLSQRVRPKARVDVVVTETLGNLGLNENIVAVLADARRRWLKPGGRIIPQAMAVTIAPLGRRPTSQRYRAGGLASATIDVRDLLGDPIQLPRIDLPGKPSNPRHPAIRKCQVQSNAVLALDSAYTARGTFTIGRTGALHGLAGWFTVWLTESIAFTTAPDAPPTHWQQALLPLRTPIPVRAGQQVQCWLSIAPDQSGWQSVVSYDFNLKGGA